MLQSVGYDKVDAVLADYSMPNVNGTQFIAHIRAAGYTSCIISIIGNRKHTEAVLEHKQGDAVLIKPVSAEDLLAALKQ